MGKGIEGTGEQGEGMERGARGGRGNGRREGIGKLENGRDSPVREGKG